MFFPYCEIERSDGALLARHFQDGLHSRFFKGEPYKELGVRIKTWTGFMRLDQVFVRMPPTDLLARAVP